MKVGIAACRTQGWPKMDWVEDAARNLGHDVLRVTSAADLHGLLQECDVVIAAQKSIAGRWPNVRHAIEDRQCPIVYWWFDLVATNPGVPIVDQPLYKVNHSMYHACDVAIVKEQNLVDEYRDDGVNAFYVDQGVPSSYPSVDFDAEPEWDLLVWGQSCSVYRERVRHARAVADAGFKVAWAGHSVPSGNFVHLPWTHPDELPRLASKARCVLSCGARNDLAYWSDQFWMALGMGACVIRRSTPGLPVGPYVTYHNDDDVVDAVRWARRNDESAKELGKEARQWVMDQHTVEHRVETVLRLALTASKAGSGRKMQTVSG